MFRARAVSTNQSAINPHLLTLLDKHFAHPYQAPIAAHNQQAFVEAAAFIASQPRPLVLDSGCGTGFSTVQLARRHQDCWVIGLDRSMDRLGRKDKPNLPDNCLLLRADVVDFWRLAATAGWQLAYHYLLYPNPWPKKAHIKRRWHGHAVFPALLALRGQLELRSNWQIYVAEFAAALEYLGYRPALRDIAYSQTPLTPFEKKYQYSQQALYSCVADLKIKKTPSNEGARCEKGMLPFLEETRFN